MCFHYISFTVVSLLLEGMRRLTHLKAKDAQGFLELFQEVFIFPKWHLNILKMLTV